MVTGSASRQSKDIVVATAKSYLDLLAPFIYQIKLEKSYPLKILVELFKI